MSTISNFSPIRNFSNSYSFNYTATGSSNYASPMDQLAPMLSLLAQLFGAFEQCQQGWGSFADDCHCHRPETRPGNSSECKTNFEQVSPPICNNPGYLTPEPKPEPKPQVQPQIQQQLQPVLPGEPTQENKYERGTKEWAQVEYEANKQWANGIAQNDEGEWQVDYLGSPVILDLDGDGKIDRTGKDGKKVDFDLFGDGTKLKTEWLKEGTKDGLLVADFDGNGKIDSGRELMRKTGVNGEQTAYQNGWEKVRALFDKNHDGKVNGKELDGLQVWVDSNGDGRTDDGELRSLASQGVSEIVIPKTGEMKSSFTKNGRSQLAEDIIFDYQLQ